MRNPVGCLLLSVAVAFVLTISFGPNETNAQWGGWPYGGYGGYGYGYGGYPWGG